MKKWAQIVLGAALGLFLVWVLFRDVNWRQVGGALATANPWWLLLSVLGVFLSFVTRVQRWSYIVRTDRHVSFRHLFSATQVGFLANFVLPARAGEPIRALMLSRLTGIPFTRSFAFVALDRVTDLFGMLAVVLISAAAFHPGHDIRLPDVVYAHPIPAGMVSLLAVQVAVFIIVLTGLLVLLYVQQRLVLRAAGWLAGLVSRRFAVLLGQWIQHFADGLHIFRSARDMGKAILWSLFTWSAFALSYATVALAFDLSLPWYAPFLMLSFLALAISLPGAPGFVGQFHFGITVPVYMLLSVNPDDAAAVETAYNQALAVAIAAHLINVGPVFAAGFWCLYREKMGLLQLRRESAREQEVAAEHGE